MASDEEPLPLIGWREWVALPEFGIRRIKAKIDTGARTSSLHAFDVEEFDGADGAAWVRFQVHPVQRNETKTVAVEAPILEYRTIRSSSGQTSHRPVVLTQVILLGVETPIELTLADRIEMGFRMLLGREAMRGRFLVDPGRSYRGGKLKRKRKKPPAD